MHVGGEVIIVNPGHDVDDLKNAMAVQMEASPNCAEFMHQFRSKESKESIVNPSPFPSLPFPSSPLPSPRAPG